MLLDIVRKLKIPDEAEESLKISNLTERLKKRIILALSDSFEFVVEDKNDYTLIIDNASKKDIEMIINIINRMENAN